MYKNWEENCGTQARKNEGGPISVALAKLSVTRMMGGAPHFFCRRWDPQFSSQFLYEPVYYKQAPNHHNVRSFVYLYKKNA